MQFSKAKQKFRLLDLKTLMEYHAACEGYDVCNDSFSNGLPGRVINRRTNGAQFYRALFVILQRITLSQMAECLPVDDNLNLDSIADFLTMFKYKSFYKFLLEHKESICNFQFIDESLSEGEFAKLIKALLADREFYNKSMLVMNTNLQNSIFDLTKSGDSVLRLYAQIPQLRVGLVNRARHLDKFGYLADEGVAATLQPDFEDYCNSKVSFDVEPNLTSVVEKYLGACMEHFFIAWFADITPKIRASRVLIKGKDSKYMYAADSLNLPKQADVENLDLYQKFKPIMSLDLSIFAKQKSKTGQTKVPFYTLEDFVIGLHTEPICIQLNNELSEVSSRSYSFALEDTLGASSSGAFINSDQSFITKIKNYKDEIRSIYNKTIDLNIANYRTTLINIAKEYTDRVNLDKADSDIPLVDYTGCAKGVQSEQQFMPDDSYSTFGNIISSIESLMQIDTLLSSKGSSLAYLWDSAVRKMNTYSSGIFLTDGIISPSTSDLFDDGLEAEALSLSLNLSDTDNLLQTLNQYHNNAGLNTMKLNNAQLSTVFHQSTDTQDTRAIITACSYTLTNSVLPLLSVSIDPKETMNVLNTVFDYLNQEHLSGITSRDFALSRRYKIFSSQAWDTQDMSMEEICLNFAVKVLFTNKDSAADFYAIIGGVFEALVGCVMSVFPNSINFVGSLLEIDPQAREEEFQKYSGNFIFPSTAEEVYQALLEPGDSPQEQAAYQVVARLYSIMYIILYVIDMTYKQGGTLDLSVTNGNEIWKDPELCVDLFIMILVMCDTVHSAICNGCDNLKPDLLKLEDLYSLSDYDTLGDKHALLSEIYIDGIHEINSLKLNNICGDFSIEQAGTLMQIADKYGQLKKQTLTTLVSISNLVVSPPPEDGSCINRLNTQFKPIARDFRLITSKDEHMNKNYNRVVEYVVCGALRVILKESLVIKNLSSIDELNKFKGYFTSYIADKTGITACQKISHSSTKQQQRNVYFVQSVLVDAVSTDQFAAKSIMRLNLDLSSVTKFDLFKKTLVEDPDTHFLARDYSEFYTIHANVGDEQVIYYLHSSGVFVGYVGMATDSHFSFMTFEEACDRKLMEGTID